jgi:hypothetical protein
MGGCKLEEYPDKAKEREKYWAFISLSKHLRTESNILSVPSLVDHLDSKFS